MYEKKMKRFWITSTIEVEAESKEKLEKLMTERGGGIWREMVFDLWNNAEITEVDL